VAFLMRPARSAATDQLKDWCVVQRAAGRLVVGLSLNVLHAEGDTDAYAARSARIVAQAVPPHSAFVPIVHDYRGTPNDWDLTVRVIELLVGEGHLPGPRLRLSAPEVKPVCAELDILLTGRMHAAVAALGVGTPVFVLGYADKAEGLLSYFGLERRTVPASDVVVDQQNVVARVAEAIDERLNDRIAIRQALPTVFSSARAVLAGPALPGRSHTAGAVTTGTPGPSRHPSS
jgi:colanic acid/amylovoran biosynthesis protein